MVRLKVNDFPLNGSLAALFQFHDGSIKGKRKHSIKIGFSMFQFHDGSIKGLLFGGATSYKCSFNSTMVRLKVQDVVNAWRYFTVSIPRWFD